MNRLSRTLVSATTFTILVAGCTSSQVPPEGFLHETTDLHDSDLSQGMYVHFDESLTGYDRFTIAPLTFRFTPRQPRPVALRDLDASERAFREAVERELIRDGRFAVAAGPGPGVLQLRAGVTDRFQRDEHDPGPGPATLELEALDSVTKKRVFAVIDPTLGQRDSGGEHTSPDDAFNRFARRLRERVGDAENQPPEAR
jgi:hypothetical protein